MVDVYLSLGTNLGDRKTNLETALNALDEKIGTSRLAVSSIVETEAWGFEGPDFLNLVVRYRTDKSPVELLEICKEIEWEMGRREELEFATDGSRIYHSRVIDIDILLYGNETVGTPELKIPHPMIEKRPFVKGPLEEIKTGS